MRGCDFMSGGAVMNDRSTNSQTHSQRLLLFVIDHDHLALRRFGSAVDIQAQAESISLIFLNQ